MNLNINTMLQKVGSFRCYQPWVPLRPANHLALELKSVQQASYRKVGLPRLASMLGIGNLRAERIATYRKTLSALCCGAAGQRSKQIGFNTTSCFKFCK